MASNSSNPFRKQDCITFFKHKCQVEDKNIIKKRQKTRNQWPKQIDHDSSFMAAMEQPPEDIVASQMSQLSAQERSVALNDLHCVGEEIQETSAVIQKSLAEFEEAVKQERTPLYEMAIDQNRAYMEDKSFRLKFLRAKLYNVPEAVRQMMSFLEHKATYFGTDKIARDISMDDLSAEDKELMLSGIFHIQDDRDRNGRGIVHFFGKMLSRCKPDSLARVGYYVLFNALVSIPDVQKRGIVVVYDDDATLPEETCSLAASEVNFRQIQLFFNSVPIRPSASHYCLQAESSPSLMLDNSMLSLFLKGSPRYALTRSRIHYYGSITELRHTLLGYGIPSDTIPVSIDGNFRSDILHLWLNKHLKATNQSFVGSPPRDIFTGVSNIDDDYSITDINSSFPNGAFGESPQLSDTDHGKIEETLWQNQMEDRASDPFEGVVLFKKGDGLLGKNPCDDSGATAGFLTEDQHPESDQSSFSTFEESDAPAIPSQYDILSESTKPNDTDVLFGKGFRSQFHPGNIRFRKFLEQHRDAYESTHHRLQRREMVAKLAQVLRSKGVRFLKKTGSSNEWAQSSNYQAEKKIAQYFRELRKEKGKKRKRAQSE